MNFFAASFYFLLLLFSSTVLHSQSSLKIIVAKKDDNIYKILLKEGLKGVEYYKQFVNLNKNKIKKGNLLQLGETYFIPKNENPVKDVKNVNIEAGTIKELGKLETAIALKGDGIYSLLRRHGISGDKNYMKFVELNKDNIKNGSLLKVGETYFIPNVTNSFVKMGKRILLSGDSDTSIFADDSDLYKLRKKNNVLENTVYYLLLDTFNPENLQVIKNTSKTRNDVAIAMAKELLQQGARVFLFEYNRNEKQLLGDYVGVINKRFLKYQGQYQRLLVMDIDKFTEFGTHNTVSISYYQKSKEGRKFANNIENIFKTKKAKLKFLKKGYGVFTDNVNLYLAKNILPAMTFIQIKSHEYDNKNLVLADKKNLVDWITTGIKNDYSNLTFED